MVENVEDYAVFVVDLSGNNASWNPGVEKLLGYREDEFVGRDASIIFPPEDRAAKAPEWELNTALRTGRCEDVRWYLRKDGSRFWANGLMILLKDETDEVRGFVKIMRDNTLHKQSEEERERLLESETAARAKDEFLALVAHELRSPLNSVKGWNGILRQQPTAEMVKKVTEIVERQCNQQTQLIEDLLDTAQITSGKISLDRKFVDLIKVITAAIDNARPAAESSGVILGIVLDPKAAQINGDEERLLQVVSNLLSNAVKFTPEGGRVDKDTGKGIEQKFLPRIFERYAQQETGFVTARRGGGLGLGLSLVRHLIEMHGGTVTAQSDGEGKGAIFTVRLPVEL